jgi:hypothetical protein
MILHGPIAVVENGQRQIAPQLILLLGSASISGPILLQSSLHDEEPAQEMWQPLMDSLRVSDVSSPIGWNESSPVH